MGACRRMQVKVKVSSSSFGRRRRKVGGPPERKGWFRDPVVLRVRQLFLGSQTRRV